jgi:hypothetical protein
MARALEENQSYGLSRAARRAAEVVYTLIGGAR